MASYLYGMRHHAWAIAPLVTGLALQSAGVHGALVIGLLGTVIGVAISCSVMAYEMEGLVAAMVRFPAVLLFIACGGVLGADIGSTMGEHRTEISEGQSQVGGISHRE